MKSHFALCALAVACIAVACSDPKPSGFLDRERMTHLMTELHIADATADRLAAIPAKRDSVRDVLYNEVFRKEGLSREVFYDSYRYYIAHPYDLDTLYSKVLDTLNTRLSAAERAAKSAQQP